MSFAWTAQGTDGAARAGRLATAHGPAETPAFMPVGTAGTVKAMTADAVRATGAAIVLANTYHLMLRPGAERIAELGGLHRFMDWPGPILTDSGGFQVMSLAGLRTIDEGGVTFRSHLDGSAHRLTPERSVAIQQMLDATISMAFDECTPFPATFAQVQASMELSMRWAARSRAAFTARPGYRAVRHRAGRRASGAAHAVRAGTHRNRLRGLRHRRPCRRRRPGGNVLRSRRNHAAPAGRPAALPDGRRRAGRHRGRSRARHRPVRLRDPDAGRTHRARLHAGRRAQPAQRPPRRRSGAARSRL